MRVRFDLWKQDLLSSRSLHFSYECVYMQLLCPYLFRQELHFVSEEQVERRYLPFGRAGLRPMRNLNVVHDDVIKKLANIQQNVARPLWDQHLAPNARFVSFLNEMLPFDTPVDVIIRRILLHVPIQIFLVDLIDIFHDTSVLLPLKLKGTMLCRQQIESLILWCFTIVFLDCNSVKGANKPASDKQLDHAQRTSYFL